MLSFEYALIYYYSPGDGAIQMSCAAMTTRKHAERFVRSGSLVLLIIMLYDEVMHHAQGQIMTLMTKTEQKEGASERRHKDGICLYLESERSRN